jgi:hypothetical protein
MKASNTFFFTACLGAILLGWFCANSPHLWLYGGIFIFYVLFVYQVLRMYERRHSCNS